MIQKIKRLIWKTEGMEFSNPPSNITGSFNLLYGNISIGTLSFHSGNWHFTYSEEFKNSKTLEPIIDFPDINKEYVNSDLWPFFASRIPTLNQPYHFKKIRQANANKDDSVALLKIFGTDTITNPFKLSAI